MLLLGEVATGATSLVPPKPQTQTEAPYPPDGKGDASVTLTLLIDTAGDVTEVTVREGLSPFREVAATTAASWRFLPATRNDVPVSARISAVISFHAPRQVAPPVENTPDRSPPPASSGALAPPAETTIEVSVKGEHEELGTIHIPRSDTRLVPGAFGDPFRVVEALPGMTPWLSGLPYFYVRGMSPENVGYVIDGIHVPLLFHVGSGPSSMAASMVDSVDLFPGAFPARYGRSAGAIIAGETTAPTYDHARADFQVRVFDADAFAEVPFDGGRGSVLGGVRYGYTGPLISLIAPDYKLGYWDYQFRISHRVGASDQISLFAFGSYDRLDNQNIPTFHVQYHRVDLRYDHPITDGNVRVAATFSSDDTLSTADTQPTLDAALRSLGGRIRAEYERHVIASAWVRAGADFGVSRFDVDRYPGQARQPHTDVQGGAYADVVLRPSRLLELVPGARIDGYEVRGRSGVSPQPRLSAKVRLTDKFSWISAMGIAHQEGTDEVFAPAKVPNPIDESSRNSYQYSEALELKLPLQMMARTTAFYTELRASEIAARQRSYGVELFLRRDLTARLGGFLSYTLSRSEITDRTATLLRGPGDRTHALSIVIGYDLGQNWRIGGRFFVESGRPYTCRYGGCYAGEFAGPVAATGNLPPFFRIDARLEKRWHFSNGKWLSATLECFNVLDKAEATGVSYGPNGGLVTGSQPAIFLPSVGIEGGL